VNTQYLTVAGRIRRELKDLNEVVDRTIAIWEDGQKIETENNYYVDATAINIHGFYAGIERVVEIIADEIDGSKPSGSSWHRELLYQATSEIKGVRPAVISADSREQLDRYRGFRHVVRNVYTFHLDEQQVGLLVAHLRPTFSKVGQELLAFAVFLEELAAD
jgi:hypothetical protein